METKICNKCKIEKSISEFGQHKTGKNGRKSFCKECLRIESKNYRNQHKKEITLRWQLRRLTPNYKIVRQNYRVKNKKEISLREKKYNQRPDIKIKRRLYIKKYYSVPENKIKQRIYRRKYRLIFQNKIANNIRVRLREIFKGILKSKRSEELLGCSFEFFESYIISKFQPGMTKENYGEWHIDHIRPCASFNLILESEQKACCHYTNLQPLWKIDNLKKGSSYLPTSI